ncbi:MAG: hypothetical protein Fur0011_1750 [Candidatus Microgenomates bacterium]
MKKFLLILSLLILPLLTPPQVFAATKTPGVTDINAMGLAIGLTGWQGDPGDLSCDAPMNLAKHSIGGICGEEVSGLLPIGAKQLASLYKVQPSSQEYIADLLNNIGVPQVSRAYAQGTGYQALASFLPFWKAFRNLAYFLYIIMFVVVGIMIMLRTKINAQTVITIQSALPNLTITLLLITFSYAIVGFMIDIMYFLMFFTSYLLDSIGILDGSTAINRLTTHSAWGVIFAGRNSIISVVAEAIRQILHANSVGGLILRFVGAGATRGFSELAVQAIPYLIAATWLALTMLKLIYVLTKSYIMLIIQTITAPIQILMNAMPGSKAFSEWLKKTASYIIPFPVAAAMFLVAAMFIGNPTNSTKLGGAINTAEKITGVEIPDRLDANPFGINESHEFYQGWSTNDVWMPPFTFDLGWEAWDIMILIGFFIFAMTPAAVTMAQNWLQVKESPYIAEAFGGASTAWGIYQWYTQQKNRKEEAEFRKAQMKNLKK